jgi:hypothetical protein
MAFPIIKSIVKLFKLYFHIALPISLSPLWPLFPHGSRLGFWHWIFFMPSFWVFLNLICMCASLLFCIERCRFFLAFLWIGLFEICLMWLLNTYSWCSLHDILSFLFEVEWPT